MATKSIKLADCLRLLHAIDTCENMVQVRHVFDCMNANLRQAIEDQADIDADEAMRQDMRRPRRR